MATRAEASDDAEAALRALGDALHYAPGHREILRRLVLAAQEAAPEATALWRHELALSAVDARGRLDRDRKLRKALGPLAAPLREIVEARGRAVLALLDFARREGGPRDGLGGRILARHALDLAQILVTGMPALEARIHEELGRLAAAELPDVRELLTALKSAMDAALSREDWGRAIELARVLGGLAAQAAFEDLEGPEAPDLSAAGRAARSGLARARAGLDAARPATIPDLEDLEALSEEERRAFDRAHRSWADPGVTRSPNGLYRVETNCGWATLVGVARTIEDHHARLVAHYGHDPFEGRPGLVRVVSRRRGLEAEGAPYWWVGGFQRGDVTTVEFTTGTIEGLGRTLTHELTHRFDGALHGGLPGWLSEGRAVWTGAAYAHSSDAEFVAEHHLIGRVERAFIQGYANRARLESLIEGTIEDYRDNYFAGYALWRFLATWNPEGEKLFAPRIPAYLEKVGRRPRDPLVLFTSHFADGADGRPEGLAAFRALWAEFLKGHHWQSRAAWLSHYRTRLPRRGDALVFDAPTWHRDRVRAEPWLGQDQAAAAARLLEAEGDREAAAEAYVWALTLDEADPDLVRDAARVLTAEGEELTAWALKARSHLRYGRPALEAPPARLRRGGGPIAFHEALGEWIADHGETAPLLAAALAADRTRLGAALGLQTPPRTADPERAAAARRPLDPLPRLVGLHGWVEDGLVGFEKRRVPELWYDDRDGHLTVGRARPREGTGRRDRRAHQRDAYARSRLWIPAGRYTLRTRIHATTSFISGALVVGATRRDRDARVHFRAGDFLYSVGAKEEAARFDEVRVRLDGRHAREGSLPGAHRRRRVELETAGSSFELVVHVDGAEMTVLCAGEVVGSYHTPDGRPLEGHVGFAAGQGAYRADSPRYVRHDRRAAAGVDTGWPEGLTLDREGTAPGRELANRRTEGLPRGPHGTVVVFVPLLRDGGPDGPLLPSEDLVLVARDRARITHDHVVAHGLPVRLVLAVPDVLTAEDRRRLEEDLFEVGPLFEPPLFHSWRSALDFRRSEGRKPRTAASILFLDPLGVLRVHARFAGGGRLPPDLLRWARVLAEREEAPLPPAAPPEDGSER